VNVLFLDIKMFIESVNEYNKENKNQFFRDIILHANSTDLHNFPFWSGEKYINYFKNRTV
jgi:hypothetical protein